MIHFIKTVYLLLRVTFDSQDYWQKDKLDPSECTLYRYEVPESLDKLDLPKISFITLLTLSLLLDIVCMAARRFSVVLLYLECVSIFVETILLGH